MSKVRQVSFSWIALALVSLTVGCSQGGSQNVDVGSVQIQIEIHSVSDQALQGVLVRSEQSEPKNGVKKRVQYTTNAEGVVRFSVPLDRALSFETECPEGFRGQALKRQLSPVLLAASREWNLEMVCEAKETPVTIAVLSAGCGELSIHLDGVPLGVTSGGVLHKVLTRGRQNTAELRAKPLVEGCLLKEPLQTFELQRTSPGIWARFTGEKKKRQRARRSGAVKNEVQRPYRL